MRFYSGVWMGLMPTFRRAHQSGASPGRRRRRAFLPGSISGRLVLNDQRDGLSVSGAGGLSLEFWRIVTSLGLPGLALGIFFMLYRSASQQWPISRRWTPLFLALWMLVGAGVVFFVLERYAPERHNSPQVYTVRVTVLSPTGQLLDDARVWSGLGGEAKKVAGGWEFELPATKRPEDRKLHLFASQGDAHAESMVVLGQAAYVSVAIRFEPLAPNPVRGTVLDEAGHAVAGARVILEETGDQTVTTVNGTFLLPPRQPGEPVTLRVKKDGYVERRQLFRAQAEQLYLQLERMTS